MLDSFFNTGTQPKAQLLVTNVPKLSLPPSATHQRPAAGANDPAPPRRHLAELAGRGRRRRMRMAQEAKEHHCVVNSTHAPWQLGSKATGHAPPPVPTLRRPPAGAGGATWAYTPFVASPGRVGTVSATLGTLTCTAKYEVMGVPVAGGSAPVYAVLAHQGSFHGFYSEQFCGFYVCTNVSYCAEATLTGAASFVSFALWGTFSPSTTRFGLVSGDNGAWWRMQCDFGGRVDTCVGVRDVNMHTCAVIVLPLDDTLQVNSCRATRSSSSTTVLAAS